MSRAKTDQRRVRSSKTNNLQLPVWIFSTMRAMKENMAVVAAWLYLSWELDIRSKAETVEKTNWSGSAHSRRAHKPQSEGKRRAVSTCPGQTLVKVNIWNVPEDVNESWHERIDSISNVNFGEVYDEFSECDITVHARGRLFGCLI
jgi:hypothetical protein